MPSFFYIACILLIMVSPQYNIRGQAACSMTTILVIDDNEALREDIADFLKMEGFTVIQAADGAEGVQMIQESAPDLVLCDVHMPEMDGFEVLSEVRSLPGYARLPFLFLTALTPLQSQAKRHGTRRG